MEQEIKPLPNEIKNSDDYKSNYKKIRNINEKTIGYRMVAAIVDFAIALFTGVLIGIFASYVIFAPIGKATGAINEEALKSYSLTMMDEEGKSHLFALNPSYTGESDSANKYVAFTDESVSDGYTTYDKYLDATSKYYTEYLTTDASFANDLNKNKYTKYYYNVFILGLQDGQGIYSPEDLDARPTFIKENTLFSYKLDGDGQTPIYDEIGVPSKECYYNDTLTTEASTKLFAYFYSSSASTLNKTISLASHENAKVEVSYTSCVYSYVLNCHFPYESDSSGNDFMYNLIVNYMAEVDKTNTWQVTYPALASIIITWIIFYLIIPLALKNGKTLGKLMFKAAVVNNLGYQVTPWQMCLRSLFPLVFIIASYLLGMITSMFLFYVLMLVVVIVSYSTTVFTKKHKAIHDYIAGTMVIDSEKSTWFKNAQEEEAYQAELAKVESSDEREERLTREYHDAIEAKKGSSEK